MEMVEIILQSSCSTLSSSIDFVLDRVYRHQVAQQDGNSFDSIDAAHIGAPLRNNGAFGQNIKLATF